MITIFIFSLFAFGCPGFLQPLKNMQVGGSSTLNCHQVGTSVQIGLCIPVCQCSQDRALPEDELLSE